MYVLIIDTGSSSMRGVLMDEKARVLYSAKTEYFMSQGADGSCEMAPRIFEDALYNVCKKVMDHAAAHDIAPAAISLTSQRSSVVPVSKEGTPIGNIIMWHDKRSAGLCSRLLKNCGEEIYGISGTRLIPILSAPKMAMLRERNYEIYQKAWKLLGIHDYLLMLITGDPFTDISLASRSSLLDVARGEWSDRLLEIFGISRDKLCYLGKPGEKAGVVTEEFALKTGLPAGLPVISAGGDQQCSILGQGLIRHGQIGVTVGTGAYACMVTNTPKLDPRREVNLNGAAMKDMWILEASTYASGLVYNWFNQNFYADSQEESYRAINEEAASAPPGSGKVIMLPYLSGKGCPHWDAYARGMFCNLSPDATRAQFARAALEGVASEVADCIQVLEQLGDQTVSEVQVAGGLTKMPVFDQMLADMTSHKIKVLENGETSALGAFMQAAVFLGIYSSHEEMVEALPVFQAGEVFMPDEKNGAVYRTIHEARKKIYASIPHKEIAGLLAELD